MEVYTERDVKKLFSEMGRICQESRELFNEADARLGDGDMGISMEKGALAINTYLKGEAGEEKDLTKLFLGCAMEFNRAAPSTLGTLISFGMMAVGKQIDHRQEISCRELGELAMVFADTIALRGKARVGDKTILDALYPYGESLKCALEAGKDLESALLEAAKAARSGMEKTQGIRAKTGRASWLDTRNMEYPDAGALLCVTIVERIIGLT